MLLAKKKCPHILNMSVCYFMTVCYKISVLVLKAVIHETGNQTVLQMIHFKGNLFAFFSLSFTASPG
jgi:hypothetical protein